jgi:hypothetical protein
MSNLKELNTAAQRATELCENLAAERDYRSGSSYLRLALIERLHADGISLDTDEVSS